MSAASRRGRNRAFADRHCTTPRALTPGDVSSLRVGPWRRLQPNAVRKLLEQYPDRSVWLPSSLEYIVTAPWRHRPEIAAIQELVAVGGAENLISAAIDRCRRAGDHLVLAVEMDELRRPSFYERVGMDMIEEIMTYEIEVNTARQLPHLPPIEFRRVSTTNPEDVQALLAIDHVSFPWLWWNSAAEFRIYGDTPGVDLYLGLVDGRPISYLGLTTFPAWGHLDRVAVIPDMQGRGYGRSAIAFALATLTRTGARRVALSTQKANLRSQLLYERFGFHRSPGFDYRLYGAQLREPTPSLTAVPEETTTFDLDVWSNDEQ